MFSERLTKVYRKIGCKMILPMQILLTLLVHLFSASVVSSQPDHIIVKECKHGQFLLSTMDNHVSAHLLRYGEWAERELQLFLSVVKPGDIVLDVGANIGAFTVPLAKAVGPYGRVYAFEPQRVIFQRMNANVALNGLSNVHTFLAAVGSERGTLKVPSIDYSVAANFAAVSLADQSVFSSLMHEIVPVLALDALFLAESEHGNTCPSFIKVDVELMEQYVLEGARQLLQRCQPILYLENPCVMTSLPLVELLYELNYTPFWDVQPSFNIDNYAKSINNFAPNQYAINTIGVPNSRLKGTQENANIGSAARNEVAMVNFVRIEKDRPFLYDYFDGRYAQSGNLTSCGDTGNTYVDSM